MSRMSKCRIVEDDIEKIVTVAASTCIQHFEFTRAEERLPINKKGHRNKYT